MTREEAIDLLDTLIGFVEDSRNSDYDTAFKMGIKALEQEPCIQEKQANADKIDVVYIDGFKAGYSQAKFDLEQEPCKDCISRQAVLAIAGDSCLDLDSYEDTKEFCDEIKELPSVTPQAIWIPVSEKLPKLDELDTTVWKQKILITGYLSFDNKKRLFVSEAFINDVINNSVHDTVVIAWMPLPKPYKTESEEEI